MEKYLFGHNGFSGLILYVSAIVGAALLMLFQINVINPVFIICCIVIPLILVFMREPLVHLMEKKKDWMPKNKGDFIIINIFELFEVLLSYITNTISFIRVGAFALAHAGMMSVVFNISHMISGSAESNNIPTIIIGNLFVIGMEGFIVSIQVLRLQFNEMFSRFYSGGGKDFVPAKVNYNVQK